MTGSNGKEIDTDMQRKKRIAAWYKDSNALYGDYNGEVDKDDVEGLLLAFEHQLMKWEVERQTKEPTSKAEIVPKEKP